MSPDVFATIVATLVGAIVGAILGSLLTWWIQRRLQLRPHIFERLVRPIREVLRSHHDHLRRLEPLGTERLTDLTSAVEITYISRQVRRHLTRYSEDCATYNNSRMVAESRFCDDFRILLGDRGFNPQPESHGNSGCYGIGLRFLADHFDPETAFPEHGPIDFVCSFAPGDDRNYFVTDVADEQLSSFRETVKDIRQRYATDPRWQDFQKIRARTRRVNRRLEHLLSTF